MQRLSRLFIGSRCPFSPAQKVQTVSLASYNTTFREQTYIRWCCIDPLRPPRLSGMWTDLAEQIVKLDQVDNLFEPKKRGRPPVSGGDEGLVCDTVRYQRSR